MTTIAYHHDSGIIAFDSRGTDDDLITNDQCMKMRRVGDEAWIFCGATCDTDRFIDHFRSENPEKPRFPITVEAIMVTEAGVFRAAVDETGEPWKSHLDGDTAIGSGRAFALAAMDHGKSAETAIRYAMTRDCKTGGSVHVLDVKSMILYEDKLTLAWVEL